MMAISVFSKRIKNRREYLKLSQDALAHIMGYSNRSAINKIESGENDVKISNLMPFAKALKTSPAYLMGWVDNPELTHEETLRLEENKTTSHSIIVSMNTPKPVISKTQRHRNKLADKIRNSSYADKQLGAIDALLATYDDTINKINGDSYEKPQILAADTATDKPIVTHTDKE